MGYSNAGKDTAGNILKDLLGNARIIKFVQLCKNRIAAHYDFDPALWENKTWRSTTMVPDIPGKTFLDLLVDAYHVYRVTNPDYWVDLTMAELPKNQDRIFTDVRNPREGQALLEVLDPSYTTVIWIIRDCATGLSSDLHQWHIFEALSGVFHCGYLRNNGTIDELRDSLSALTPRVVA